MDSKLEIGTAMSGMVSLTITKKGSQYRITSHLAPDAPNYKK
jgi:hypothetical protein